MNFNISHDIAVGLFVRSRPRFDTYSGVIVDKLFFGLVLGCSKKFSYLCTQTD